MNVFILVAVLLLGMGSQGQFLMSPRTQYELGYRDKEPPPCRPATRAELSAEGFAPEGKASTFNLKGFYVCETRILKYGDRDSFADYVARNAVDRAKEVVRGIAQDRRRWGQSAAHPWALEVDADDERIKVLVERLYWTEMTQTLGARSVSRRPIDPQAPRLRVQLRRVQDASLLFGVWAAAPGADWKKL